MAQPEFNFVPLASFATFIVRGSMHQAMFTSPADFSAYLDYEQYSVGGFEYVGPRHTEAEIYRRDRSIVATVVRIDHT